MSSLGWSPVLLGLGIQAIVVIAIVVAVVIALRALVGIDRSLKVLVEQGVARGEGPFGPEAGGRAADDEPGPAPSAG